MMLHPILDVAASAR